MTNGIRNSLLVVGVVLIASSGFLYQKITNTVEKSDPTPTSHRHKTKVVGEKGLPSSPPATRSKARQTLPNPIPSPHPPGSAEDGRWIAARIAAIHDLEWFDDNASLLQILAELRNPIAQIRAAALEATRAFGSRNAIPHLATRASETANLLEQKELTDLIEHLQLPTVIEELGQDIEK